MMEIISLEHVHVSVQVSLDPDGLSGVLVVHAVDRTKQGTLLKVASEQVSPETVLRMIAMHAIAESFAEDAPQLDVPTMLHQFAEQLAQARAARRST